MDGGKVAFRQMKDGTREEYELLERYERQYAAQLPERVLSALEELEVGLAGYDISRLGHSLQSASRAEDEGADEEMILGALIHDIGDALAPYNHAEVAAALIRPYVRPQVTWIVEQHALFQSYYYAHHFGGDRNARDRLKDHRWYRDCVDFCERWDQSAFDPAYPTRPLAHFAPLVREIFTRPANDPRYVRGD